VIRGMIDTDKVRLMEGGQLGTGVGETRKTRSRSNGSRVRARVPSVPEEPMFMNGEQKGPEGRRKMMEVAA
jgi:hypothetical protein